MSCLREDGKFEIYIIQTRAEGYMDGQWFNANLDHFGAPEGFSPSGECWQKTGITGTFDLDQAIYGLNRISIKHPGKEFRIAKISVSQETTEIATMKVEQ